MCRGGGVYCYLSSMPVAGSILCAASLAPPHPSTLPQKRNGFWENVTKLKMCVLIVSGTFI